VLRNSDSAWGAVAKSFHWLVAAIIFVQFALGKIAEEMAVSPQKLELFVWHKSLGVTVLLLVLLRIVWRLTDAPPRPATVRARWEHLAAKMSHGLLYLLMLAVPLSGWWISDTSRISFKAYWFIPVPDLLTADKAASQVAEQVHGFLTKALLVLIVLHVAAALRHHLMLRNDTLRRMLPSRRRERA